MGWAHPPYDSDPSGGVGRADAQAPNAELLYHTFAGSYPVLPATTESVGHEGFDSREIYGDLQRATSTITLFIKGSPAEVHDCTLLSNFAVGAPHPWAAKGGQEFAPYRSAYAIDIKLRNWQFGAESDQDDEGQAWTKVIITYQQRPCPNMYEERSRMALTTRLEWYTQEPVEVYGPDGEGPPELKHIFIRGSEQPVAILTPTPIRTRYWMRVKLTQAQKKKIEDAEGRLNKETFAGRPKHAWMLDAAVIDPIFLLSPEDPESEGMYEVTLVFRADPLRLHKYVWPVPGDDLRPKTPVIGDTYDSLHEMKQMYAETETDFDDLVPTNPNDCVPPT